MSVYVESLASATLDVLWTHTQTPQLHRRWDLRFSRIGYLPRLDDAAPQRFCYATRIGFGLEVNGVRFLTRYDYNIVPVIWTRGTASVKSWRHKHRPPMLAKCYRTIERRRPSSAWPT
jgi:hypothetical protein